MSTVTRNPTRAVAIGSLTIGGGNPIAVQSMCAVATRNTEACAAQVNQLSAAGAGLVRIAVDSKADAAALGEIRARTAGANLAVDLQENYRIATVCAPLVDKLRYNPGHLYHHQRGRAWPDKVKFLADTAGENGCALRIGVNGGSVDPALREQFPAGDKVAPMVASALAHCAVLDDAGFTRYCVSLKDSDPAKVVDANRRFAGQRPEVPLHLGVTEAGLPPDGVIKTRIAFEQLIGRGIGDTIRVSLTLPNARKHEEVEAGRAILDDIKNNRVRSVVRFNPGGLNIISCPSCARVENESFVDLAEKVRDLAAHAKNHAVTIAVMGCRVNGPGETDDADLGLWCGPRFVNLKRGEKKIGAFRYDEILPRLKKELDAIISAG